MAAAGKTLTVYLAADLKKFMNGEIATIELDDKTTGRWYPLNVVK